MADEAPLSTEHRIRLEALNLAHQLAPVFLNVHQGNTAKCRGETLLLAKRYETYLLTGKTLSSADGVKEKSDAQQE